LKVRQASCDRETEASTIDVWTRVGGPEERLENPFSIAIRDAGAAVGDREYEPPTVALDCELHRRVGARAPKRVVDQVIEDSQ
jgi:hypothetical protein